MPVNSNTLNTTSVEPLIVSSTINNAEVIRSFPCPLLDIVNLIYMAPLRHPVSVEEELPYDNLQGGDLTPCQMSHSDSPLRDQIPNTPATLHPGKGTMELRLSHNPTQAGGLWTEDLETESQPSTVRSVLSRACKQGAPGKPNVPSGAGVA
jgi:hypothetical protein